MNSLGNNVEQYFSKLLLLLLLFIGTGLSLAFSISYSYSILQGRDVGTVGSNLTTFSLFAKQFVATLIGLGGIIYLLKTPTKMLKRISDLLILLGSIAMIYTAMVGPEINGSRRWIVIAGLSIQTGDFVRLALILYLSNIFTQYHKIITQEDDREVISKVSIKLAIRFIISVAIYGGALYLQRDYSSLLISACVILAMLLVSDIPRSWKFFGILFCVVLIVIMIQSNPNRMSRILNYLNPGLDPLGQDFQLMQSYKLIQNGGWLGSGVGSSMLEVLRLPYFNNDFVFSIIVGEYGLIGALVVLMFFWLLCWYGFKVGKKLYHIDRFYYFILLASIISIVVSAVAHVAVTLGITPTAGLNLPFYSSGGSSMISALLSYGFILRATLALYSYEKQKHASTYQIDIGQVQPIPQEK